MGFHSHCSVRLLLQVKLLSLYYSSVKNEIVLPYSRKLWRDFEFGELIIFFQNHKYFYALSTCMEVQAIAKFKIGQCIPMPGSPNLMLTKISRCTV